MRMTPALALAVLLASPNSLRPQAQDPSQALRSVVQSFQTAWNAHDAAAVAGFFTDDADQVMEEGPTTVGRQALQLWWKNRFASMEPGRKIALSVITVRLVAPQVAVINVAATSGGRDAQGKALPADSDRGTWVVIQKNGRWLMAALRVYSAEHAAPK